MLELKQTEYSLELIGKSANTIQSEKATKNPQFENKLKRAHVCIEYEGAIIGFGVTVHCCCLPSKYC